ncbi:PbpA [Desulfosarcina sp. OttesenSCG-928-G10]|nr:PbpA [Desulfosarcina sp. OttesenSCG-928-G10]
MTDMYRPDDSRISRPPTWKAYQARLSAEECSTSPNKKKSSPKLNPKVKWIGLALMTLAAAGGLFFRDGAPAPENRSIRFPIQAPAPRIQKSDVRFLIGKTPVAAISAKPVQVVFGDRSYTVTTSLDPGLEQYLDTQLDRVNSRYIGIVAMCPETGRILAMTGFDKTDAAANPCLAAEFPAASIFKIITAAAIVEQKGYTPHTALTFSGYTHTLYKRQLTDTVDANARSITLEEAFAKSVNPVFGKMGALYLDRKVVENMGAAFAFNQEVGFELPWPASHLALTDDAFHRAEIASGFNRETRISPLHGALIAATVVNGGKPVEPTVVEKIVDDTGACVYKSTPFVLPAAVTPKTAQVLAQLMRTTVVSGTGKKVFLDQDQDPILSRLDIGGKTGSISNDEKNIRFDWFAGFATEKQGTGKIVVAVMVGHEQYIGTRSTQYARMVMEHYFKDYFARKKPVEEHFSG